MEINATLRHLRMAPRKVRLVVDLVRGLSVPEDETRLSFLQKEAARPVLKLLRSAMANASHNFKLDPATLVVKKITADGGATLKRFRPRAMGRAAPIRKRTTHIFLTLAPATDAPVAKPRASRAAAKASSVASAAPVAEKKVVKKAAPKRKAATKKADSASA